jgi:hypothetical protein
VIDKIVRHQKYNFDTYLGFNLSHFLWAMGRQTSFSQFSPHQIIIVSSYRYPHPFNFTILSQNINKIETRIKRFSTSELAGRPSYKSS